MSGLPCSRQPSIRAPPAPRCCCSTGGGRWSGAGYQRDPPALPAARLGGARSRRSLGRSTLRGAGRAPASMAGDPPIEAVGHHQPARDHGAVGAQQRPPGGTGHRLAGPPHPGRCAELAPAGHEPPVRPGPAWCIDPYFSATKIAWLLATRTRAAAPRAEAGEIAFGTVDSWLAWRLSGGQAARHRRQQRLAHAAVRPAHAATSATSCAQLFRVPARAAAAGWCPHRDSWPHRTACPGLADGTPLAGIAGDQQAALFGQGCFTPGDAKCTYGTGAFLLVNIGDQPTISRAAPADQRGLAAATARTHVYALEGSAFVAGALVQWLRDGLGIIAQGGRGRGAGAAASPTAAGWSSCRRCPGWARPTGARRRGV